jgi:hypothetical protein
MFVRWSEGSRPVEFYAKEEPSGAVEDSFLRKRSKREAVDGLFRKKGPDGSVWRQPEARQDWMAVVLHESESTQVVG